MPKRLFPVNLPTTQWLEFAAAGFSRPVPGVIYRTAEPPCCGVPLGGVSTGCLDIDARGVYGFRTIFNAYSPMRGSDINRIPRKLPQIEPILGLATGGKVWVLATREMLGGGDILWCSEPHMLEVRGEKPDQCVVRAPRVEGVEAAQEIDYWGHFPVADLEFETTAPVSVGLRAWAPFIPGDTAASNIPAAVFEVHLRNETSEEQRGTLAFNFPGPEPEEARIGEFTRQPVSEEFQGVLVSAAGWAEQFVGVLDGERARTGGGLHLRPTAWSKIAEELPQPAFRLSGGSELYQDAGCSLAVDFALPPGEEKTVRFLVAWYVPQWEGVHKSWHGQDAVDERGRLRYRWHGAAAASDTHYWTQMYAARYSGALDVARRMAGEHASLLQRVLAWQAVVYGEEQLPAWLRDSLVNNLALIAEDSYWAQARPPLGDWCYPGGAFALTESPRGCPQTSCIPCDWYGNLPIVYFYPELARSNLRLFKQYQLETGEIPFAIGHIADLPDFASPAYYWQVSLNGMCYVDMVDRVWQRTGDDTVLREFYDAVKKCNIFTMNLKRGPGGVISMPEEGGMEWFEFGDWAGMATHMGGLRLAQLEMVQRMAEAMGDSEYASQCRAWLADGQRALEEELWAGGYYLNFLDKEGGKKSDDVMGYQLDGEWAARFHGLPGVFRKDRVPITLETIRRCNVALTPEVGAANFARPDGSPLPRDAQVAFYGQYAMFAPELLVLGMTYAYAGQREFGAELARRQWANLVLRQRHPWDLPNMVRGDTGQRIFGTDYYQNMMLWAMPAALSGQDLGSASAPDALVGRMIAAEQTED